VRPLYAVASVMLLTIALFILLTEENFDDDNPSVKEHPRWQVNRVQNFKSGLFDEQNVWLSELQVLTLQVSVFLVV